jgi:choline/ethanolamine kinase
MTRYLEEALNNVSFEGAGDEEKRVKLQRLMTFDLALELDTLKSLLSKVHSPVVFCHNDLQEGNILFVEDHADSSKGDAPSWRLRPIDFEYASYNYRGFDIGNHFCEWCYDYTVSTPPYFAARLPDFPSREQQLAFLRSYLDEYAAVDQSPSTPRLGEASEAERRLGGAEKGAESREKEAELMLIEVGAFALASHFLWGLWGIVQANMSDIEFGYLDYSLARFNAYFEQKQHLLSSPLAAHLRPNSPLSNGSHSLDSSESTNGSEAWTNGVGHLLCTHI